MQKVIISELKPTNGRKSFGGKAILMYNPDNRAHYKEPCEKDAESSVRHMNRRTIGII